MGEKFHKNNVPPSVKKRSIKVRWAVSIIAVIVIVLVFSGFLNLLNRFYDNYRLMIKSPVIFQMPVQLEKRKPMIIKVTPTKTPTPTPEETSFVPKAYAEVKHSNTEILKRVYQLESSGGKNDSCRDQGKFNGYGYGQSTFVWNCFDTLDEVTGKVDAWFTKKFNEGYSLSEALCYYNTGYRTSDCTYYQKYLSL